MQVIYKYIKKSQYSVVFTSVLHANADIRFKHFSFTHSRYPAEGQGSVGAAARACDTVLRSGWGHGRSWGYAATQLQEPVQSRYAPGTSRRTATHTSHYRGLVPVVNKEKTQRAWDCIVSNTPALLNSCLWLVRRCGLIFYNSRFDNSSDFMAFMELSVHFFLHVIIIFIVILHFFFCWVCEGDKKGGWYRNNSLYLL